MGTPRGVRLAEVTCDVAVAVFAAWTLAVHATVLLGGTLWAALAGFVVVGGVGLGALARSSPGATSAAKRSPGRPVPAPWLALRLLGILGGVCVGWWVWHAGTALDGASARWIWAASVSILLPATAVLVLRTPTAAEPPAADSPLAGAGLWGLVLVAVLAALFIHRIDVDDAFYVNVAAAAADRPGRALLAADTMHGVPGLPLHMPAHRLHTWELWNGLWSRLTGIAPIAVFHLVAAPLGAGLAVLANARLLRRIAPERWLAAVAALVVVLLVTGEAHRFHTNFAFVRMWQGKGLMLFVFVPLVYHAALEFGRSGGARSLVLLGAAQIAAVGCSSTAVWLAPAAALSALAATALPAPRQLGRLALGALVSAYPIVAGLALRPLVQQIATPTPALLAAPAGDWLALSLLEVLGSGPLRAISMASLVGAWALMTSPIGMRFAATIPLAAFVVLLDPYTEGFIVSNVTGASMWRALWALPIPLFLALVLTAPLALRPWLGQVRPGPAWQRVAVGVCVSLLVAFAVAIPRAPVWGERNAAASLDKPWVAWPGLKVPAREYGWAEQLTERAGAGAVVIAPPRVSAWLPTFRDPVYPQLVIGRYLQRFEAQLGPEEVERRRRATRFAAGGRSPANGRAFEAALAAGAEAVVLARKGNPRTAQRILSRAGFERVDADESYELWARVSADG